MAETNLIIGYMINLKKIIHEGTWRYIGQRVQGIALSDIPVGGVSIERIHSHTGGDCLQVGSVNRRNAFVIERDPFRLLYVRPDYKSYRKAAEKVFAKCNWDIDYDHALGKNIAKELGYSYVLLLRIVPGVNRAHGRYERSTAISGPHPSLCFADNRIRDKWIGRKPTFMTNSHPAPYTPNKLSDYGLTLKQSGKWGFAMGVEDSTLPRGWLRPLL